MAMLAEPRRKQKWSLNPRGKEWSDDSNKFGQKMLEKMGWTSGKGLGAKEQGMTEHVRVSLKTDTTGIGYKNDGMDEAWTETQDGFNNFLQELSKSQGNIVEKTAEVKSEPLSGKSLEMRSQQSRARVHYRKFTRGKDVNRYSSKDLANIFGQKDLIKTVIKEEETNDTEISDSVGCQDTMGGVITINGGNMAEYFRKKGKGLSKSPTNKADSQSNDLESENEHVGFGFVSPNTKKYNIGETETPCNYAFENPCLRLHSPQNEGDTSNECTPRKRKKRSVDHNNLDSKNYAKKLKVGSTAENGCEEGFVNDALNLDSQTDEVCNGKEFEVSRAQFGLANSALDLTDETDDKKRVTFNDCVEYSTDPIKKKKVKSMLDRFEVENTKHKRKRKHDATENNCVSGFVNEALDVEEVSEEINDNEVNERKSKKSKKRKESRRSNLETIVETPEEEKELREQEIDGNLEHVLETSVFEESSSNKEMKKKKKKKKNKVKEDIISEQTDTVLGGEIEETKEAEITIETEMDFTKKEEEYQKSSKNSKKKKKKCKNNLESSLNSDENESANLEIKDEVEESSKELEQQEENIVQPRKSKKNKKKKDTSTNDTEIETNTKEKEISDKENLNREEAIDKVKKPKRGKKRRSTIEQTVVENSTSAQSAEPVNHGSAQKTKSPITPIRKNGNQAFHAIRSPWTEKARMSKRLLKSLFHRNAVQKFPGSNIHEIKGYGAEVE